MVINAIFVLLASKLFLNPLIVFTTVAISVLNKSAKCCKPTVKAVVCVGLAAQLNWLTTQSSALFVLPAKKHNWYTTGMLKPSKLRKLVLMRCGHSFQKTEALHNRGTEPGRFLDGLESCLL